MSTGRIRAYSDKRAKIKHIGAKVLAVYVAVVMIITMSPWQKMQASAETSTSTSAATAAQTNTAASATDKVASTATEMQPAATAIQTTAPDTQAATVDTNAAANDSAAADAATSIAPQSTAEEDGQYSITIDYVDQNGNKLQPSWQGLAANGAAWSQKSPDIENYELVDSAQATVSGTASGSEHFLTYTVKYQLVQTTYTVFHQKQLNSGAYYTADTETFTATAGDVVTATAKVYSGFHCITTNKSLTVKADGTASITLKYDIDEPITYSVYFYTQGTAIDPINVAEGAAITAPADPTRTGYTFVGWDIDGDGTADGLPATMPGHNVYAKAVWTPATVSYVINYYQQNSDGTTYTLKDTTTGSGLTGSTTSTAPAKDTSTKTSEYAWFQYDHENPATINADGTSVLNVYYNRVTVTVNAYLKMDDGSQTLYYTKDALYGVGDAEPDSAAVLAAYKAAGGTAKSFFGWHSDLAKAYYTWFYRNSDSTDFDTKTATYTTDFTNKDSYTYYWMYQLEELDGTYGTPVVHQASVYAESPYGLLNGSSKGFTCIGCRASTNLYSGGDVADVTWSDTWITEPNYRGKWFWVKDLYGDKNNAGEFKYSRNTYTDTYYSGGTEVATVDHLYEAPYSTSGDCNGGALTPPTEDYTFDGWYTNADFVGDAVSDATQDASSAVYYAKWKASIATVTYDSEGGSAVESEKLDKGSVAAMPEEPTKDGYIFDGWYYEGSDGTASPVYYNFDQPVESNMTLHAIWIQAAPSSAVDYTVVHQTTDGTVLATEQGNGIVGEAVAASALATTDAARQGYTYVDGQTKSMTLTAQSADNVITFTYSKDGAYKYTVHYVDRATGKQLAADYSFASDKNLVDVTAKSIDGYTVESTTGWVSADKTEYTFYYNTTPAPSMSLSKTASSSTAAPGETVTYTLTATNSGNAAAIGYWVKDYIPSNTTFVSCDAAGTAGSTIYGKEFVSWFFPSIAAGASETMTLTVKVNECQSGTVVDNMALSQITGSPNQPADITGTDPAGGSSNIASFTVGVANALPKTGDALPWGIVLISLIVGASALVLSKRRLGQDKK